MPDNGTSCTPDHCAYGPGHACDKVTAHPELFPAEGGWTYAWRKRRGWSKDSRPSW